MRACAVLYLDGITYMDLFDNESIDLVRTGRDERPTRILQAEYDADNRMTALNSTDRKWIHNSNKIPVTEISAQEDSTKLFFRDKNRFLL